MGHGNTCLGTWDMRYEGCNVGMHDQARKPGKDFLECLKSILNQESKVHSFNCWESMPVSFTVHLFTKHKIKYYTFCHVTINLNSLAVTRGQESGAQDFELDAGLLWYENSRIFIDYTTKAVFPSIFLYTDMTTYLKSRWQPCGIYFCPLNHGRWSLLPPLSSYDSYFKPLHLFFACQPDVINTMFSDSKASVSKYITVELND